MTDIILTPTNQLTQAQDEYAVLVATTLQTVGARSKRVYQRTYDAWLEWCLEQGMSPLEHHAAKVRDFLVDQDVVVKTRQNRLSHLRKLAQVHALDYRRPELQAVYGSLKLLQAPTEDANDSDRMKQRKLTAKEVHAILDVWWEDNPIHVRNYALLWFLFATGVRRSEAVDMRWQDVDLDNATAFIRRGKGGKSRHAAIFGDAAVEALRHWQAVSGMGRTWLWCPMDAHGNVNADTPISADTLYQIVQRTTALSGVEFTPHTARHTLLSTMHEQGVAIAEIQAQAGHADISTTGHYLHAGDAAKRREMMREVY